MTRYTMTAAAFICALCLGACSNPAGPAGQYGTVKGTITSTSGQPVAGATITIDYTIKTTSKTDGTYESDTVPQAPASAPAIVSVQASGYQPQQRTDIVVDVGKTTIVNFTLASG